jgi:hypothetical protein
MFDFRKRRSIDIPLRDEFNADPGTYVLGNNTDTPVIRAGMHCRPKSLLKLSATSPKISSLHFWYDNCTAQYAGVIRLLVKETPKA